MADEKTAQSAVAPQIGPPVQHASRVAAYHSATDIVISFATTRAILDPATGNPGANVALEWTNTIALSPVLADHLRQILDFVVKDYETKFGKIPVDPAFKIESK